jgi:hypothetical protein
MLTFQDDYRGKVYAPLDAVTVQGVAGTLVVRDGAGRVYVREAAPGDDVTFRVAGVLGTHHVSLEDEGGRVTDTAAFRVDCATAIEDADGEFRDLLSMLYFTMVQGDGRAYHWARYQGRLYYFFICWLRDHVHVLKGMKYFAGRLKDGIDLYRESQREDGMIWDNVHRRVPPTPEPIHWDVRFDYDGFIRRFDDDAYEFKRIPVENDVEYLFVEGLYYTWKATGDDAWMARALDAAQRALEYSVTSPYRWSEQYGLLKRGHTIDTWDFQSEADCLDDFAGWPDPMAVHPEKTRFGVMFGDNTGYAVACEYLAEMLTAAGRADEAEAYRTRAAQIRERLNALSWNGRFFTHHVPEQEGLDRDLGVDERAQVSLSNAYSLNRRIDHAQCVAIIETYRALRDDLPPGAPGEWYTIYPPFRRGYGGHNAMWQYMNASVTPIVAGELAHGAFEHGFEAYGVDILRRLMALGRRHGGRFHSSYTGALPAPPPRTFRPLPLADGAPPARELAGVPFCVGEIAPGAAPEGGVRLGSGEGAQPGLDLPVDGRAASLYLLHAALKAAPGGVVGTVTLHYADGTAFTQYVVQGHNVLPWSQWQYVEAPNPRKGAKHSEIAWRAQDRVHLNMQVLAYGLDNPHPEREIARIALTAAEGARWAVLGATLSDAPVAFPADPVSYGIPSGWSAAAVVYALIEGLAGVKDTGVAFDRALLAPRWAAAGVDEVAVTVKYEASGGYVCYRYRREGAGLTLHFTGSAAKMQVEVLLPEGARASSVELDGAPAPAAHQRVEGSTYVCVPVEGVGAHRLDVKLR